MMNRPFSWLSSRGTGLIGLTALAMTSAILGGCVTDRQIGGEGGANGGGSGSASGDASAGCSVSFPHVPSLGSITFVVKNNHATPIYIPTSAFCQSRFSVTPSPGAEPQPGEFPTSEGTCEHPVPPPLDCLGVTGNLIEPGGTGELEWSGFVYPHPTAPDGCPALNCVQDEAAKRGTLEVSISVEADAPSCAGQAPPCLDHISLSATKSFNYPDDVNAEIDIN